MFALLSVLLDRGDGDNGGGSEGGTLRGRGDERRRPWTAVSDLPVLLWCPLAVFIRCVMATLHLRQKISNAPMFDCSASVMGKLSSIVRGRHHKRDGSARPRDSHLPSLFWFLPRAPFSLTPFPLWGNETRKVEWKRKKMEHLIFHCMESLPLPRRLWLRLVG